VAPLANPNWRGPWDCAEFASWCAYQAYGIIFAVRPPDPRMGESYSGWWYEDALAQNRTIPLGEALATPGAVLVRRPRVVDGKRRVGHVAISLGDGRTIEAKDRATGVAIVPNASGRLWTLGLTLPGVAYGQAAPAAAYVEPTALLYLRDPFLHDPAVAAVQRALAGNGVDPGGADGYFGPLTESAVLGFQVKAGLVPDGVVGPETATALGLGWPIVPTAEDRTAFGQSATMPFDPNGAAVKRALAGEVLEPRPANADPLATTAGDPVTFQFERRGKTYYAAPSRGAPFFLASEVSYTDDRPRVGLAQRTADVTQIDDAGVYEPSEWAAPGRLDRWA
jgi:N-acetylmuramoyl-L-alanine amidase